MSFISLFSSEILDVYHDLDNAWLYLDWKGRQELAWVQEACRQVSALIEQTGVHKALNDNTHITNTSWELVRWVAYDYLPQAAAAGIEYVAWVNSPILDCRNHIDIMASLLDQKPQVALFDDVASAYEWLSDVNIPARH